MIVNRSSTIPLSSRQTLLWLDEQLFPEAHYNHLVLTLELSGPLDTERLSAAWREVVVQRDAFCLRPDPQQAQQRFYPISSPALPLVSLPADELSSWLAERCALPFPEPGGLWEASLLRLAPERHVFSLRQHHLASDPYSLLLLAADLAARYSGRAPTSAPSFQEYLESEAAYRTSAEASLNQEYWNRQLAAGAPPLRPYGIARTDRSVAIARGWLAESVERTRRLEAATAAASFAGDEPWLARLRVMATATAAFVYRITGSREILLGLPLPNRTPRFANTCGLLMEQAFLRIAVEEGATFESLGRTVREELALAMRHGRACVGQHALEYVSLNYLPAPAICFTGLETDVQVESFPTLQTEAGGPVGDLRDTLGVTVFDFAGAALRLSLDMHRTTFEERVRRRAGRHLLRVIDALTSDTGAVLDAVDLIDEEERRFVLQAGSGPHRAQPAPDLLERFAEQAARRASHPAVVGQDATLSYAELDAYSNQLAHRLRTLGVERESRVGVALPRGARELTSFLATLKAGGAYVPVDLSHPVERVRLILDDARPQVLITTTDSPLAKAVPAGTSLVLLDDLAIDTRGFEATPLPQVCSPDWLAYILFTSGSTGRPKGVEIQRGGIASFLRSVAVAPGLSENDRWLAIATTTFDMSTMDLYLPLYVGGTVVIADRESATDPRRIRQQLESKTITVLQATPAMWRLLIEAGWKGDRRLRIFAGGEALSAELANQLLDRGAEVWNLYGPTETTVYSTVERVSRGERQVLVGRPIDETQVYLLDAAKQLVPVGVVGEICIGGAGLARGYHRRPDLTTERFFADPFGDAGERLYRTGDLGRLLDDGRFECLGRIDHQVKIRGFRIELGEIESALRGTPGVKEIVAVAEIQGGGDPRLVAYWVGEATQAALYERARGKLPAYMVPTGYVRLETFPLTPTGKVDRKALPRFETAAEARPQGQRPSNDLEVRMATIWSDVLGISPIGIDQDFFALGGSSVKVIQARARIEKEFGVELPLKAFFETPTVKSLIERLGDAGSPDEPLVIHLRRGGAGVPPLFCLVGVQLYQDIALALEGERPVIGMHVPIRGIRGRDPCPTIPEIAQHYVALIRQEQPQGPYHLAGLCFGGIVAFEVARQLEALGEAVPLVAIFDGYLPAALKVNPLARLRALLVQGLARPGEVPARLAVKLRRFWQRLSPTRPVVPKSAAGERREELIDVLMNGTDADLEMVRYQDTVSPVAAHVMAFHALESLLPAGGYLDPDLGWGHLAGRVSVYRIPSGHLGIVREPHARRVAEVLAAAMAA